MGDYKTIKIRGATGPCKVRIGSTTVGTSYSRKRGAYFSWEFENTGTNRFTVTCAKRKLRFAVAVTWAKPRVPSEPEPNNRESAPAKPTAPRLTGSDAEAEIYWQSARFRFTNLARGWCADWVYYKRADMFERIEKWAYKQWVADGTHYWDVRSGQRKRVNDAAEPTPGWFHTAREQARYMPEFAYLGSYGELRPESPISWLVAARRAGFTVDRVPHAGDVEVTPGHVAYVESISADGLHYHLTEMGASNPGIVFRRTEGTDWGNINNSGAYFVG